MDQLTTGRSNREIVGMHSPHSATSPAIAAGQPEAAATADRRSRGDESVLRPIP